MTATSQVTLSSAVGVAGTRQADSAIRDGELVDDVRSTLEDLGRADDRESAFRKAFDTNWRRLLDYRGGLSQEMSRLLGARRDENPARILEALTAAEAAVTDAALREAEMGLQVHEAGASPVARLLPSWRRQQRHLASLVSVERERLDRDLREWSFRQEALRHRARTQATANKASNKLDAVPHGRLAERIQGVDRAISVLRMGDDAASACLARWDLDALVRVAELRRLLDAYGRLDAVAWEYYCNAGIPPAPATESVSRPTVLLERGRVVAVGRTPGGQVVGMLVEPVLGLQAGTRLDSIAIQDVVAILEQLSAAELSRDTHLLEGYLDAVADDWRTSYGRDRATDRDTGQGASSSAGETPFDVLGVTADMDGDRIAEAFRAQMQALEGLPNPAPQRRLIAAYKAIRAMRKEDRAETGP